MNRVAIGAVLGVLSLLLLASGAIVLLSPFEAEHTWNGVPVQCSSVVFATTYENGALPCMLERAQWATWGWGLFLTGLTLLLSTCIAFATTQQRRGGPGTANEDLAPQGGPRGPQGSNEGVYVDQRADGTYRADPAWAATLIDETRERLTRGDES